MLQLEGFKEKRSQNLLDAIEGSKNTKLENFIYSLGIPHVGIKTSEDLAKRYKTLDALKAASREDLLQVPDIGEVVADEIKKFFTDPRIKEGLQHLLDQGIQIEEIEETSNKIDESILDKRFVITGTLENFTRKEIETMISEKGGKTSSSVSKNTDYLIAGEKAGSKLTKAQELNVTILSEEEFLNLIK